MGAVLDWLALSFSKSQAELPMPMQLFQYVFVAPRRCDESDCPRWISWEPLALTLEVLQALNPEIHALLGKLENEVVPIATDWLLWATQMHPYRMQWAR